MRRKGNRVVAIPPCELCRGVSRRKRGSPCGLRAQLRASSNTQIKEPRGEKSSFWSPGAWLFIVIY